MDYSKTLDKCGGKAVVNHVFESGETILWVSGIESSFRLCVSDILTASGDIFDELKSK